MIDKFKVNCFNEWGKLNSIIVGNLLLFNFKEKKNCLSYIIKYFKEIQEDRNNFISILKQFDVEIIELETNYEYEDLIYCLRNTDNNFSSVMGSPRNTILTLGNNILDFNSSNPNYFLITRIYYKILSELNIKYNNKWFSFPWAINYKKNNNILHNLKFKSEEELLNIINNNNDYDNLAIESACLLRCGRDIFVNISTIGAMNAFKYLKTNFLEFNFHPMSLVRNHIDGTISLIRPGLMLLNYTWKDKLEYLPKYFYNWDKIFSDKHDDIVINNFNELTSGTTDVNILVINDKYIICLDYMYKELSKKFKKYNIECIPITLRNEELWGGGPHCITTEINRESILESYF
jgi:N-dimethylarginine dimethylaminohydrolase